MQNQLQNLLHTIPCSEHSVFLQQDRKFVVTKNISEPKILNFPQCDVVSAKQSLLMTALEINGERLYLLESSDFIFVVENPNTKLKCGVIMLLLEYQAVLGLFFSKFDININYKQLITNYSTQLINNQILRVPTQQNQMSFTTDSFICYNSVKMPFLQRPQPYKNQKYAVLSFLNSSSANFYLNLQAVSSIPKEILVLVCIQQTELRQLKLLQSVCVDSNVNYLQEQLNCAQKALNGQEQIFIIIDIVKNVVMGQVQSVSQISDILPHKCSINARQYIVSQQYVVILGIKNNYYKYIQIDPDQDFLFVYSNSNQDLSWIEHVQYYPVILMIKNSTKENIAQIMLKHVNLTRNLGICLDLPQVESAIKKLAGESEQLLFICQSANLLQTSIQSVATNDNAGQQKIKTVEDFTLEQLQMKNGQKFIKPISGQRLDPLRTLFNNYRDLSDEIKHEHFTFIIQDQNKDAIIAEMLFKQVDQYKKTDKLTFEQFRKIMERLQ
ncbi:Conserved_hypothetical protein [Hexamita inflata]|uniref:Uncharacterized protein n=1 Tax=Hexamita inflata TaxID=28002 RepID=A0AA86NN35_9EUKA|nr:Conserved hypothetical protein [Hexamita inflata]